MEQAGKISRRIMKQAFSVCRPGCTTLEINQLIESHFKKLDAAPWFKEVNDYPYASCISVNEVWLHGVPGKKLLKKGDVVSIDIGVKYKNHYVDNCWTKAIENKNQKVTKFLKVGELALAEAISQFQIGNRTGDISSIIQKVIESEGYSVIREYVGHGVGKSYHENPPVPCYGTKGAGPLLKEGQTLAIEVMYAEKSPECKVSDDGWSVVSKDGSLTGMFEHTVALTVDGPKILTK